jgi:DNA-binding GntR family transcriptional regulator
MSEMKVAPALDEKKNTIASQLVEKLRETILTGELAPGVKINLDRVRDRLDVSLSPLREALARLIADGLVEFEDNRGYRVAPVSLANLAEITTLRAEFETLALRYAILVGDVEWESNVIRSLHGLNRTPRDSGIPETLGQWEAAHFAFHVSLIAGCGMPQLLSFCRVLHRLNDRYRRIFLKTQPGDRNVSTEHSEIAQGAVARDSEFACSRLADHIQRTGVNLRKHLSTTLPS